MEDARRQASLLWDLDRRHPVAEHLVFLVLLAAVNHLAPAAVVVEALADQAGDPMGFRETAQILAVSVELGSMATEEEEEEEVLLLELAEPAEHLLLAQTIVAAVGVA